MNKVLVIVMAALLHGAVAVAASPAVTVNGEELQRQPVSLAFEGDNVVLTFTDGTATYDMESVVITLGLDGVRDCEFMSYSSIVGNEMRVDGLTGVTTVSLYDASGRHMGDTRVNDGSARVDTSALSKGLYLLHCGKQCIKFIIR